MNTILCYKWLILCIVISMQAAELKLADMGVHIKLTEIETLDINLSWLMLPDNTKIQIGQKQKTNITIPEKTLVLKGHSKKYPSFTKVIIKQVSNELLTIASFYSDDANKEIYPEQFVTIGIRYPDLAEVVPN